MRSCTCQGAPLPERELCGVVCGRERGYVRADDPKRGLVEAFLFLGVLSAERAVLASRIIDPVGDPRNSVSRHTGRTGN